MVDKCDTKCSGLERLEQQVEDIRRQNGSDHKEFRLQLQEIEKENVKQKERFDRIMDNLNDLKSDNKELLSKVSDFSQKADNVTKLEKDVDELKGRDGRTWLDIKGNLGKLVLALLFAIVVVAIGLGKYL